MRFMMTAGIVALVIAFSVPRQYNSVPMSPAYDWPLTLSEWGLFTDPMSDLRPDHGVIPYHVNAPLYSDYAMKSRFIKLPDQGTMTFNDSVSLGMPDGTILVKNFFYYSDSRDTSVRIILETRLLVLDHGVWRAMSYAWNATQDEAYRAIAGDEREISWLDEHGKDQHLRYLIPDANQCKNCHNRDDTLLPLGLTARQVDDPERKQLAAWQKSGLLSGLNDSAHYDRLVDYLDPKYSLNDRARSYLDANCGHCHSPHGSARTSGLDLTIYAEDPHALGVLKSPVAAGRGSGGFLYNIVPGKPRQSILLYRMQSSDPGVRMPEINRQIPHAEGIDLIAEWIRQL